MMKSFARTLAMLVPVAGMVVAASASDASAAGRMGRGYFGKQQDRLTANVIAQLSGDNLRVSASDLSFQNFTPGRPGQIALTLEVTVNGRTTPVARKFVQTNAYRFTTWQNAGSWNVDLGRFGRAARPGSRGNVCIVAEHPQTGVDYGRECQAFTVIGQPVIKPLPAVALAQEIGVEKLSPEEAKIVADLEAKNGAPIMAQIEAAAVANTPQEEVKKQAEAELKPQVEAVAQAEGETTAKEAAKEVAADAGGAAAQVKVVADAAPATRGLNLKKAFKTVVNKGKQLVANTVGKHINSFAAKVTEKATGFIQKTAGKIVNNFLPKVTSAVEKKLGLQPGKLSFLQNKVAGFVNKTAASLSTKVSNTIANRIVPAVNKKIATFASAGQPKEVQETIAEASVEVQAEVEAGGEGDGE